jgi:chaperonin GroES
MRCLAEWPPAPVDERGPHAVGFCTNAVEGMIGHKQDAGAIFADNLLGFRIGLPVRLEIAGLLHEDLTRQDLREIDMKFRPLHDRVVVTRIDADDKTAGGIIIPDTAKEKPSEGEVIAVGPGGRDEAGKIIPIDLKVGDRVLFGKWSGTEVKLDGIEYLIMKESDIMGVIEQTAARKKAA